MNPFIPLQKANLAIIAGNANKKIIESLEALDIKVIKTIRCKEVYDSIAYHPDIVIHPINHNSLIIAPNVYDYYRNELKGYNLNLIKGEKYLTCKYPGNIAYNVGRLSRAAIHNFKYTDKILLDHLQKEGIELINVSQGYSKCSIAIIDEDTIITADRPIYRKLKEKDYEVLEIQPGYIELKGQKYGFIGGASGSLDKDRLLLSGSLKNHPDREKIENFIFQKEKKIIELSDSEILDIGSIISLYCN